MNLAEFRNYISNKQIIGFGCGLQGRRMATILDNWNLLKNVLCYIDNDVTKIGTEYQRGSFSCPIISLDDAMMRYDNDVIILITCVDYKSVYQQMAEKGCQFKDVISIDEITKNQLQVSDYDHIIKESETPLIPKKIHYAWLGGVMPYELKKNVEHWKELCPDYEFFEWNDQNYDVTVNNYMKQAYERKIWGFVPDYMRLDVIYKQGGIYLDTDIEMIQRPDEMLYQHCFGCIDGSLTMNLGSGFGAVAGMDVIKQLRDCYDHVSFVMKDGTINNTPCMSYSYHVLEEYGFKVNDELQNVHGMNIYPMIIQGGIQNIKIKKVTNKTFWVHYGCKSWFDKK